MKLFKHIAFLFLLLVCSGAMAQHYQFTQFYTAQTYLNPAFTGANACSRLAVNYRDQWTAVPGTFVSSQISWDHYLKRYNSGVGLLLFNDKAGSGNLKTTQANLLYAYEIHLTQTIVARAGTSFGFVQRSVDYSNLIFGDQIARNNAGATIEIPAITKYYFDANSGVIVYDALTWIGFSANHLTSPNQALLNNNSKLPREFKVHGGRKFIMKNQGESKTLKQKSLNNYTFAFNYKHQNKFDQLDIGAYVTKAPLVLGVWYRGIPVLKAYQPGYSNNDAVALVLGITLDRFNIGYSYDYTISKLQTRSIIGSHEITLSYQFCNPATVKKRRPIVLACPKF